MIKTAPEEKGLPNTATNAELEAALTAQAVEIAELKKANKVKEDQINALTELVNTFGNKVNELLNEKNGK